MNQSGTKKPIKTKMLALNKGEYTGDIIQSLQLEGSTITNTVYALNANMPDWHYHENLHICFVFEQGKAETKHNTTYSKKEGSLFFYHAEETHRWTSPAPISRSANIEIETAFLNKYGLTEQHVKQAIETNVNTRSLMLRLQKEMGSKDQNNKLHLQTLLLDIISRQQKEQHTIAPIWVIKLKQLLNDEWNQVLSLQEISAQVNAHPVTISKNFRKYFDSTLSEYQRRIKVEHSIDLIKNSQMSFAEIALHCGFSDQSHFIRNFKEQTGFLPTDYRKF